MLHGNRRRTRFCLLLGVLALGAGTAWLLYPRPSDQRQIEDLLRRGEHGVETKNVSEIMSCLAPGYRDSEQTSRGQVQRRALEWAHVEERGELKIENYHLTIGKERATGTLDAVFVLTGQGARTAVPMHLTMAFVKQRQGWRKIWLITSVDGYREGRMIEGISNGE